MRSPCFAALVLALTAVAHADFIQTPHVKATSEGLDPKWSKAIAETIATAREVYAGEFACDMPKVVVATLTCKEGEPTRLFTDGQDHLFLSLPSEEKLAQPSRSGVFNLYGMCHELGHMAMYRVLKDRDWMTGAAAEGWAHYAGSVVVDRVFAAKGPSLWPDAYEYKADGTARLKRQLEAKSPDPTSKAAGEWQKLGAIIGQKGFAKLFAAWQAADVNASKPTDTLLDTAVKAFPDKKDALTAWWKAASPLFVKPIDASGFKPETVQAARLTGKPVKLAFDDGQPDGRKSTAGSGHARKFATPDADEWYIRTVSVYGAQHGRTAGATFDVALCDAEMKPIAVWKKPYSAFKTTAGWVRLEVTPTRVPKDFNLCLNFRPSATQGVFVSWDSSTTGNSRNATPGQPGGVFEQGDWMIRVDLDRLKAPASRPAK